MADDAGWWCRSGFLRRLTDADAVFRGARPPRRTIARLLALRVAGLELARERIVAVAVLDARATQSASWKLPLHEAATMAVRQVFIEQSWRFIASSRGLVGC